MSEEQTVTATLDERGSRYGKFKDHAAITQALKQVMKGNNADLTLMQRGYFRWKWRKLTPDQREALEMIAHKIGRILNGDPNYADSWHDIAGYATLVDLQLQGKGK